MRNMSGVKAVGFDISIVFVFPALNPGREMRYPVNKIFQLCNDIVDDRQEPVLEEGNEDTYLAGNRHLGLYCGASIYADEGISAIGAIGIHKSEVCVDIIKREELRSSLTSSINTIKCQRSTHTDETDDCNCGVDGREDGATGESVGGCCRCIKCEIRDRRCNAVFQFQNERAVCWDCRRISIISSISELVDIEGAHDAVSLPREAPVNRSVPLADVSPTSARLKVSERDEVSQLITTRSNDMRCLLKNKVTLYLPATVVPSAREPAHTS